MVEAIITNSIEVVFWTRSPNRKLMLDDFAKLEVIVHDIFFCCCLFVCFYLLFLQCLWMFMNGMVQCLCLYLWESFSLSHFHSKQIFGFMPSFHYLHPASQCKTTGKYNVIMWYFWMLPLDKDCLRASLKESSITGLHWENVILIQRFLASSKSIQQPTLKYTQASFFLETETLDICDRCLSAYKCARRQHLADGFGLTSIPFTVSKLTVCSYSHKHVITLCFIYKGKHI